MSLLEQSSSLSRRLVLAATLVLAAVGCQSADEGGSADLVCLKQEEEETINALIMQRGRAGVAEKEFAAATLRDARRFAADASAKGRNWGPAAKSYGESVVCHPTVEGLLGYAHAEAMLDIPRPVFQEALDIKVHTFRAAATRYQLAIELGERIGQPIPSRQRRQVAAKIQCLQTFVASPDPARPPCELVKAALQTSKITSA